jgi:hypothetical protein
MRFRPRHYILIAIILALGVYNLIRVHRAREHSAPLSSAVPASLGPVPHSAAWQAFDKAANLRDSPDASFQPALHDLQTQIDTAPPDQKADLNGCRTWLLFYRQGAMHASAQDPWRQRSTQHLNSCVAQHRDLSS